MKVDFRMDGERTSLLLTPENESDRQLMRFLNTGHEAVTATIIPIHSDLKIKSATIHMNHVWKGLGAGRDEAGVVWRGDPDMQVLQQGKEACDRFIAAWDEMWAGATSMENTSTDQYNRTVVAYKNVALASHGAEQIKGSLS